MLSFCTTCKGRLHHLRQTLPHNLRVCADREGIEFVLLDYSSNDGLEEWVRDNLVAEIASGRVVFLSAPGYQYFNINHARNIVHRQAKGNILCSLDADVFVSSDFIDAIIQTFSGDAKVITHGRKSAWGRICVRRDHFFAVGGYNEEITGWGRDDQDFISRAALHCGLERICHSDFDRVILHDDEERVRNYESKDKRASLLRNTRIMEERLKNRDYIVNQGKEWGSAKKLYRNFTQVHPDESRN